MKKKCENSVSFIEGHLALLGYKVEDKVTEYEGVVSSISFDLYGCIQALVVPVELSKDGNIEPGVWLDVQRLAVSKAVKRVMEPPDFEGSIAKGGKGPASLPLK